MPERRVSACARSVLLHGPGGSSSRVRPVLALYQRARLSGFDEGAAGNLVAYSVGLPPLASGWRVIEIERLLFLRWLARERPTALGQAA